MHLLTITPNPAIDVALECDRLEWDETLAARSVRRAAGGKGLNMARVANALGERATAIFLGGGAAGRFLLEELELAGIEGVLVPTAGETRSNIVVRAPATGRTLKVNMPGAAVRRGEANDLLSVVGERLGNADAIALAGSMPPEMPPDAVETMLELIARASNTRGVPFLADLQGEWLRMACRVGRPALVKPNREELAEAVERAIAGRADSIAAARELLTLGARAVAVTDGPREALLVTNDGCWAAQPPAVDQRAVAGMGDAFGTGYLLAVAAGEAPAEAFAQAMAFGAAVAAARETELLNADQVDLLRRAIHVREAEY